MKIKRSTFDLWKKRLIVFSVSALVFSILWVYFGTRLFTVTNYEVVGAPDDYTQRIVDEAHTIALVKIFRVIPGNRIFSYHHDQLVHAVATILPNTSAVSISPRGLHTLRIQVTSHTPYFRMGDNEAITKEGILYTEIHDTSTLTTLVLATTSVRQEMDNKGIIFVSVPGIDKEKLASISLLVSKINSIIFQVSKIEIDAFGDVSLYDERSVSKVIYLGNQEVDKVWSNLVSAVDTEPLKSKLANSKDKLEYLDARFGNKVFFKFTNDTKTAIIQSHATTTQVTPATTTLPNTSH